MTAAKQAPGTMPRKDYQPDAPGPLRGVRVLDLSRLVAGNVLTMVLADFGAEVIKVEPPEGDTLRAWRTEGVATSWKIYGRGKKSLCLDFRQQGASELLLKLVAGSDVLVESFRPGTLEAMGLAPAALLEANARLVLVRISGWGQTGPYSHRPGFGTLIEGMAGFADVNGYADRGPLLPPMYMADTYAALYGASALMIALREVEVNGGMGQVIDLPLLDPMVMMLGPQAANYRLTGEVRERTGSRSTTTAPRNVYEASDGKWVCLSASIQRMSERLFRSIDREDMIADPRFATNNARLQHVEALDAIIGEFISKRTQQENVAFFDAAGVTIGPIYDISDIVHDPHFAAREIIADYPDPDMGQFPQHAVIPRLSGTPGAIRHAAPALGEHNEEVLTAMGVAADEIRRLRQVRVLCDVPTAEPPKDEIT